MNIQNESIMKTSILTFLLIFAATVLWAVPSDSLNKANDLYNQGKFQQSIDTYERILAMGYESAELYYNLGNAYYRTKEVAPSLLNYERAKLLAPSDSDIQFNIEMANQLVVDKIEALPKPFFKKWRTALVNANSTDGWARISLFVFILGLVILGLYMFTRTTFIKKLSFAGFIVAFFIAISALFLANAQHQMRSHSRGAIVFSSTVTVKASPNESGTALFVIHEGLKVEIVDAVGDWYQIRIADGNVGWMKKEDLQVI
jgi:tetratricopeptide (TPR) repeat protein